jgi:hypothetical protein
MVDGWDDEISRDDAKKQLLFCKLEKYVENLSHNPYYFCRFLALHQNEKPHNRQLEAPIQISSGNRRQRVLYRDYGNV